MSRSARIENGPLSIVFYTENGRFSVYREGGAVLVNRATVRIGTPDGKTSIAEPNYAHAAESRSIGDETGGGKRLVVHSRDSRKKFDIVSSFTLHENRNSVIVETVVVNVSPHEAALGGIEPVCILEEDGGAFNWPGASRVLTNGPMYYDAGLIHDFSDPYREPEPYGPTKGGVLSPDFPYPSAGRIRSWWNIALFGGYDKQGLACGFIENTSGLGQMIVSKTASGGLSLYTESVFAPGTTLQPGARIGSGRFMIAIAPNPYTALEDFAAAMGSPHRARARSIVNGWCGWFFTYEFITEAEVIRNAEFAARHLKPYGLEYIQIDEGYQRCHGDWEANGRFPHGMKWLAEKIKSLGLKPGLWIAPYVVSETAPLFRRHPEWLLRDPNGRPMRVGPWPNEDSDMARREHPLRYGLDITHPGAAEWLFELFDTAANRWGFEMFKIDFVAWSLLSARRYFDPAATPAQTYRKGMEIIRRAVGPDRHINDCGPGPVSVGLIDSMRIEYDQNYGYAEAAWRQYFANASSSAPAAAKRYYFHKRTWINDADHVCIALLSIAQAQAAASVIALSGGNLISGDRLPDLDASRLEILKKIFPAFGQAARPVDLFDSDCPSVFALTIQRPFGQWTVVGLFNPSETDPVVKSFPMERLWLDPRKTYLAYDFWMERFLGETSGTLRATVWPAHVRLLALHEKTGVPQVVSTDRHVLQGAIELEDVKWDGAAGTLSGISTGPIGTAHNVAVYLPEARSWVQGENCLHRDFDDYTVKLVDEHILRVHVRFRRATRVKWRIESNRIFEGTLPSSAAMQTPG